MTTWVNGKLDPVDFHTNRHIVRRLKLKCTECKKFCTTTSTDANSLEYALTAVIDGGGLGVPQ